MPSNACDRCHRRKVRCDKIQPQCGPCKRADVACEYAVSEHQLRRRTVQKLERRIRDLQADNESLNAQLRRSEGPTEGHEGRQEREGSQRQRAIESGNEREAETASPLDGEVAEEVIQMSLIAGGGHHFVGSTSGLLLANLLQSRPQAPSSLNTSWKPSISLTPQTGSGLPPKTLAAELIKAYCSHDHLCYPFLSTKSLYKSLDAVYEDREKDPVDAFFVDMTLAIGTAQVHKFNWNGVYDAETHYNRAMTRLADVLARDGIERLQALLLVCQYRMGTTSSNTTTSVWHLIGVAARTCLEMGLHRAATYAHEAEEEMETKRRCFWSLVALDRVTSLALGRPLALQLEDIDVDLPPCSTEELPEDSSPLSSAPYGTPQYRAATSVFVHIVRYRLICGKIINALHRSTKHVSFASINYEEMRTALARELQEWHTETGNLPLVKSDATAASPASGSSFRCEEWYRLLYHNGMLMLFRPSPCLNDASVNSLALQNIYDSAREAILLYASLHRSRKMNYSWITMHSVFLAGLSYIFALRHHFQPSTQRARLHTTPTISQVVNDTRACSKVLVAVSERWDLARNCSDLFDRLSDAVVADVVEASTPQTGMNVVDSVPFGAVDNTFRDCFGDLQSLGLDEFHNDAISQLSQEWFFGLDETQRYY